MTGFIHSKESFGTVDGPGVRFVVFMQGCNLRCGCCHNPDTWECEGGKLYTAKELVEKYDAKNCAKLVLEAAEVYEKRGILL